MANDIQIRRDKVKARIRGRVSGTPERPRLTIYKSLNRIYVQAVDDEAGRTLAEASTRSTEIAESIAKLNKTAAAAEASTVDSTAVAPAPQQTPAASAPVDPAPGAPDAKS